MKKPRFEGITTGTRFGPEIKKNNFCSTLIPLEGIRGSSKDRVPIFWAPDVDVRFPAYAFVDTGVITPRPRATSVYRAAPTPAQPD